MTSADHIYRLNQFIESKKIKYAQYYNKTYSQLETFYAHLNGDFSVVVKPRKEDGTWEDFEILAVFQDKEQALDFFFQEGGQIS